MLHEDEVVVDKDTVTKRGRVATETVTEDREVSEEIRKEQIEADGASPTAKQNVGSVTRCAPPLTATPTRPPLTPKPRSIRASPISGTRHCVRRALISALCGAGYRRAQDR